MIPDSGPLRMLKSVGEGGTEGREGGEGRKQKRRWEGRLRGAERRRRFRGGGRREERGEEGGKEGRWEGGDGRREGNKEGRKGGKAEVHRKPPPPIEVPLRAHISITKKLNRQTKMYTVYKADKSQAYSVKCLHCRIAV